MLALSVRLEEVWPRARATQTIDTIPFAIHLSIDTIPRSKSVPLRGGRLARTRQPITPGWESSRCWWCGEGAATWEAAGGLSIEGFATGSGRLSRGCTQAFSYNVAPAPGDAEDEALRELSAAFPLPPGRAALSCT